MPRIHLVLLCFVALLGLTACGGGGGGGDGGDPGPPGALRIIALEGEDADGTQGKFIAFPAAPFMATALGGWCAFVGYTDDVTIPELLYVLQPDRTLVNVFASGDNVPGQGSDGTIDSIEDLWLCEDGTVMAYVTITGDSNGISFGILAAEVDAGAATNKTVVILDQTDLSGQHASFAGAELDLIDTLSVRKEEDGTLWFLGRDDLNGELHLFHVDKDGTNLTVRTRVGQDLSSGVVLSVDAFGVDPTGTHFTVVVTSDLGVGTMVFTDLSGAPFSREIIPGGGLDGGGSLDNVHKGGRIICNSAGGVIWMGEGSLQAIDDVLLFYQNSLAPQPPTVLARTSDPAPNTGGGILSSMNALNTPTFTRFAQFNTSLIGAQQPINFGNFAVLTLAGSLQLDSSSAIVSNNVPEPAAYVSLRQKTRNYDEVSPDGSVLFAMRWLSTSALFWGVRESNGALVVFALAAEGGAAPNGYVFGSFQLSSAHTTADGIALFRADLVSGEGTRTGLLCQSQ